jgi:hypothetical protein
MVTLFKNFQPIPDEVMLKKRNGGCIKRSNRASGEYYSYYAPHHSDSHRGEEYLGRLVNKQEQIYYNNKWGFFKFTIENGFTSVNGTYSRIFEDGQNFFNLRYGDIWLLHDLYHSTNFEAVLKSIVPFDNDTLHALLAYKLSAHDNAFINANAWFQRSYARILYPSAALSSDSISIFLKKLGEQSTREKFFDNYHKFLNDDKNSDVLICNSILIDSTGAQNDIKITLTAMNNHNRVINNEFRVIYVVDHERNLPIYMDQVPGNVVDVSTLKYIVSLLQYRKIYIKCCVLDAGYYGDENLLYLDTIKINYLVRMCNNRKLFKELIERESQDLGNNVDYRILYRKRYLHCKKVILESNTDTVHYAYIILDFEKEQIDRNTVYAKYTDRTEILHKSLYFGKFILYSNFNIDEAEVLDLYYTREQIEQVFDISKNNGSMLPLRTHQADTTMGHLLLSFIATIISLQLNNKLKNTKYCAHSALDIMKNLSAYVSDEFQSVEPLITSEKELATILKLNQENPLKVDLSKSYTNKYLNNLRDNRKRRRPKGKKNSSFSYTNKNNTKNNSDESLSETKMTHHTDVKSRRGRPKGSKNIRQRNSLVYNNFDAVEKRKPGRPKGSKNRPKIHSLTNFNKNNSDKRKPGRPKGSKNIPKV